MEEKPGGGDSSLPRQQEQQQPGEHAESRTTIVQKIEKKQSTIGALREHFDEFRKASLEEHKQ